MGRKMLAWVYARCGQMLCFGFGGLGVTYGADDGGLSGVIAGGFLLITGLGLKGLHFWRART